MNCCQCNGQCNHVGPHQYCAEHKAPKLMGQPITEITRTYIMDNRASFLNLDKIFPVLNQHD